MNAVELKTKPAAERLLGFEPGRGDWAALLLLPASLVVFFSAVVLGGEVFFFRDVSLEIVPKARFLADRGWPELWNPYFFFGMPAAANPQWFSFYPLKLLFFLGHAPQILSLYVVIHFGIALLSAYVLLRSLGRRPAASGAGAISLAYGGYMVSAGNLVLVLNSSAWVMAILWAAWMALRSGSMRFAVAGGLLWGLQVLGGEPQISCLTGVVLLVFIAGLIIGRDDLPARRASIKRAAAAVALAAVVALAVSAVQWLLALELFSHSNRAGGLPFHEAVEWSLSPGVLSTLFYPNFFTRAAATDYWVLGFANSELPYLLSIYPGITVLIIALFGLASRRRELFVYAIFAAGFIWLSLGEHGGLYWLLYHVLPGFDRFRIPERCMFGFAVMLALMVPAGVERLFYRESARKGEDKERRLLLYFSVTLAVVCAGGLVAVNLLAGDIEEPAGPGDWLRYHQALMSASRLCSVMFAGVCLGLMLIARYIPRAGRVLAPLLCVLVFSDLYAAHRFANPTTNPGFYELSDHAARGLLEPGSDQRAMIFEPDSRQERTLGAGRNVADYFERHRRNLQYFLPLEARVRDVRSHGSFYVSDVDVWKGLLSSAAPGLKERLLALAGVRFIIQPGSPVRAIKDAMPRAYVVPEAEWLADRDSVLGAMKQEGFDPRERVLLEGGPPAEPPAKRDNLFLPVKIISEENQRVEVLVPRGNPGFLVLQDTFYPGWQARADGEETKIYRGNGLFRAVPVSQEGAVVEFSYRPGMFLAGAIISAASILFCIGCLLRGRRSVLVWLVLSAILLLLPTVQGGTTYAPVTALRALVLLLAAAWGWSLAGKRQPVFYRTRIDPWVAGFWILATASFSMSRYFYISLYWHLNIFTLVVLFYFLVQFLADHGQEGGRRREFMHLVLLAGAVQSVWATIEWVTGQGRASAGYFNPSMLAGALMIISPYPLSRALDLLRTRDRGDPARAAAYLCLFALVAAGILATRSRAVIIWPLPLAMVAIPGIQGILVSRGFTEKGARNKSCLAAAAVMAIAIALVIMLPNPLRHRLMHIHQDPYAFERTNIWRAGLEMIKDHPLGVGPGMYKYYSHQHRFPVSDVMVGRFERTANTAHNEYIHVAAEMSPLAVVLLAAPMLMLVQACRRRGSGAGHGSEVPAAGAGVLAAGLHALFDSNLHNLSIAVLAVAMAGVAVSCLSGAGDQPSPAADRRGWVRGVDISRGGRYVLPALFTILFIVGALLNAWLGWGFGKVLKASQERDPVLSVIRLREAREYAFGNTMAYKHLAAALYRKFKTDMEPALLAEAIKAADHAIELNPADPRPYRQKAQYHLALFLMSGDREQGRIAESSYEKALELDPADIDACLGMALLEGARGNIGAEIRWLGKALQIEPYDLPARLQLARALLEAGRVDKARAQWKEFKQRWKQVRREKSRRADAFDTQYQRKRVTVDRDAVEEMKSLVQQLPEKLK